MHTKTASGIEVVALMRIEGARGAAGASVFNKVRSQPVRSVRQESGMIGFALACALKGF